MKGKIVHQERFAITFYISYIIEHELNIRWDEAICPSGINKKYQLVVPSRCFPFTEERMVSRIEQCLDYLRTTLVCASFWTYDPTYPRRRFFHYATAALILIEF